jgi:hypothetical protein
MPMCRRKTGPLRSPTVPKPNSPLPFNKYHKNLPNHFFPPILRMKPTKRIVVKRFHTYGYGLSNK